VIELRSFVESDVPALLRAFSDPDIVLWNPGPTDAAEAWDWANQRNDHSAGTHASFAIGDPHDGALLGSISVFHIDADQGDVEMGYWVGPDARRRGVATAAVNAALDHVFGPLGLRRGYLFHAVENIASCGVARRAGLRHEGTLRESYRYPDGRWHDEHLHAILASERA
jgi:RimJ/RimL family protein N-acetyltransferase